MACQYLFQVILFLEANNSHPLYIHIYIFCTVVSHTILLNMNNF